VLLFLMVFAGVVIAHLPALTLIPAVNHDEAAINAAARSWSNSGKVSLTLLANPGTSYDHAYYWHPPGHLVVMAAAYKLFGFSIFVTRFESLFFGALSAALLFLVARSVAQSTAAGILAALFVAAHPLWDWVCRSGRMDASAFAFGLGAILAWRLRPGEGISFRRAASVGLLMGLGSLFHVVLLFWVPTLLIAESAAARRVLWKPGFVCAMVSAAPLIIWVAAVFSIGDGAAWHEQFWEYAVVQRRASIPLLGRPWAEGLLFAGEMRFAPLFAATVIAGVILAWGRLESGAWRWCFGALATSLVLVTFLMGKGTGVYPSYWFMWLACLSGAGWAKVLVSSSGRGARAWKWLLAAGLTNALALHLFWACVGLYQAPGRDPRRVDAFFAAHLFAGAVVVGQEDIWYAVEKAGGSLRIWVPPDPKLHDFYVTHAGSVTVPPAGFRKIATLNDVMPLIFGKYFSVTSCAYDLWGAYPAR
jgi:4-amino-4-deoxy-L-arabinose transferase-like glycosyltransferase